MIVKGTAFLGRKSYLEKALGKDVFDAFLAEAAKRDPAFAQPILPTTRIEVDAFLRLNDAVVRRFYRGDEKSYIAFGEASAVWALTEGPYKRLLASRSVDEFAASAPVIYRNYFTEGDAKAEHVRPDCVELRLTGIETRHVYFEYAVNGYFRKGLELVTGQPVTMKAAKGFSRGDADVLYTFHLRP
jgi:hypothetical protein